MPSWVPDLHLTPDLIGRAARAVGWTYLAAALALIVLLAVPAVTDPLRLSRLRHLRRQHGLGAAQRQHRHHPPDRAGIDQRRRHRCDKEVCRTLCRCCTASSISRRPTGRAGSSRRATPTRSPIRSRSSLQGSGDRVVFSIPYLGYVVHFARSAVGRALLLFVPADAPGGHRPLADVEGRWPATVHERGAAVLARAARAGSH